MTARKGGEIEFLTRVTTTLPPPPLPADARVDYFSTDQIEQQPPDDEDYMQLPAVRLTLIICYGIVFVIGNLSNVAMLVVCVRQWFESIRMVSTSSSNYQNNISSAVTSNF